MSYKRLGNDRRFTPAGPNLELLPSSIMGDTFGRKGMEYAIATQHGVTEAINARLRLAHAKANARLVEVLAKLGTIGKEFDGGSMVQERRATGRARVDGLLILNDERSSTPNAMAIEMGRSAYMVTDKNGNTYEVGGMEGVGILHAGFDMRPGMLQGTGGGEFL